MAKEELSIQGADIALVRLTPFRKRTVSDSAMKKLRATIESVGLIGPLIVTPKGDDFFILDGYLRFTVLLEMGVETAPCIILDTKDAYTCNKQVCNITKSQESRMLQKALSVIDERTIAAVFGLKQMKPRLTKEEANKLHPEIVQAFDTGKITKVCVNEIKNVTPKRQKEILTEIKKTGARSANFVRAQVLKTPKSERVAESKNHSPWSKQNVERKSLMKKLKSVSEQHDLYSRLYRQYVSDLTKTVIYIREMISCSRLFHQKASGPKWPRIREKKVCNPLNHSTRQESRLKRSSKPNIRKN